jgi:hypothetical protein
MTGTASVANTAPRLRYVDLAAMRHLTTGLTFDLDQCVPVLDHALRGLNEQTCCLDKGRCLCHWALSL